MWVDICAVMQLGGTASCALHLVNAVLASDCLLTSSALDQPCNLFNFLLSAQVDLQAAFAL